MKGENFKAGFSRNVVPVLVAVVVMALTLVTVPLTATPARVFGGYGWSSNMNDPGGAQWIKYASFVSTPPISPAPPTSQPVVLSSLPAVAAANSEPTLVTATASNSEPTSAPVAAFNSESTLATVAINAAAIQGNDVDFTGFTLDGVPAASWALSGDGDLVLNFKLGGLYATGDVVTLTGKYLGGKTFTVSVTVK